MAPRSPRKLQYGVAATLDGYIAGPNGEYDWIPRDPDIDFAAVFSRFDTLLMGRKTFATMAKAGQAESPFGMKVVVASRTLNPADYPSVTVLADGLKDAVTTLKMQPGKDIWLFGGGEMFRTLAGLGLVDSVAVSVVPVMLGAGVPLFPASSTRVRLKLVKQHVYKKTGIVSLTYDVLLGS